MGRADRSADHACAGDDAACGSFGSKSVYGLKLEDSVPHGLDDFPAAYGCSHAHGQGADELDPEGNFHCIQVTKEKQGQGNDAHGLLSVIEAVREGHKACRDKLHASKPGVDASPSEACAHPVDDKHGQKACAKTCKRRANEGQDNLGDNTREVDGLKAGMGPGGAKQAADKCVGGRGGDTKVPGKQIPDYGANKSCEDKDLRAFNHGRIDKTSSQCLGYFGSEEGSKQVQECGHGDSHAGCGDLGGNDCGNGVGAVVGAIGEIENEGCDDNEDEKKGYLKHFSSPLLQYVQKVLLPDAEDFPDLCRSAST